jgi:hypothetical protein
MYFLNTSGILSDSLAHTLFDTLAGESDRVNLARASHDRCGDRTYTVNGTFKDETVLLCCIGA